MPPPRRGPGSPRIRRRTAPSARRRRIRRPRPPEAGAMERVAIVGAGIAGLGCAHFLQRRCELTLYERNDYIGGHSHTVEVRRGRAAPHAGGGPAGEERGPVPQAAPAALRSRAFALRNISVVQTLHTRAITRLVLQGRSTQAAFFRCCCRLSGTPQPCSP